jgi:hypothetical protein
MAVIAIVGNTTAFAASAGAATARVNVGLAASFADLLADELQQRGPVMPPPPPAPAPAPQVYPYIGVPVVAAAARGEAAARKRLPARRDRQPPRR